MERLWAPWRMEYILDDNKNEDCLFCRMFNEEKDNENHVLFRTKHAFAVMNKYPYNNGHLMIAPVKHAANIEDLETDEIADIMFSVQKSVKLLKKTMNPHGFNIGLNLGEVAGAGVLDHLHYHIVPRWNGDSNFMPVISNTKIIPQALDDLYKTLITALE